MSERNPLIFAPGTDTDYGRRVAAHLGVEPARHEERAFEDGEHKIRPLVGVRGRDVYVVQSLHGDAERGVNDKLVRLLFFLGALRDAEAARVTAVVPYLPYARKDRRTRPRDPVTTRYLAELLEGMGVDRVVALEVHNPAAAENAFRRPFVHLTAAPLFLEAIHDVAGDDAVVVSPDAGGYKRAEGMREALAERHGATAGMAFMEKKRSEGVVSGEALVGDVTGRAAVIVDDLVSTGGTLARAAHACRSAGATAVFAAAAHGLFTGDASRVLGEAPIERLFITDCVPPFRLDERLVRERIAVIDSTPLVAEAIRRLHGNGSITELLTHYGA